MKPSHSGVETLSLKTVFVLNALSCLFFGGLFTVSSYSIAAFLSGGSEGEQIILVMGLALLFNAGHLTKAALFGAKPWEVLYFSLGDFAWVLLTLVLILFGVIATQAGIVASLLVASMVGAFGALQWRGRRQLDLRRSKSFNA